MVKSSDIYVDYSVRSDFEIIDAKEFLYSINKIQVHDNPYNTMG